MHSHSRVQSTPRHLPSWLIDNLVDKQILPQFACRRTTSALVPSAAMDKSRSFLSYCSLAILATSISSEVLADQLLPTSKNVRAAVERSLPYIEKVGTAWMQQRKCSSCHNVTFLIWSHNEAAAREFNVDRTKLAEWTKWSLADALSDRFWFMLRPRAIVS